MRGGRRDVSGWSRTREHMAMRPHLGANLPVGMSCLAACHARQCSQPACIKRCHARQSTRQSSQLCSPPRAAYVSMFALLLHFGTVGSLCEASHARGTLPGCPSKGPE